MPNYVTNIITFGTDDGAKAAFRRMLDTVRVDGKELGSISFEKLLPMPEYVRASMKSGPDHAAHGGQSKNQNGAEKTVFPLWYAWSCDHWGSPWDAVDFCPLDPERGDSTMTFSTAWSPVPLVVTELSRWFPDQTITYCWAENENIGMNVGEMDLKGGAVLSELIPEEESREAYELSADILGLDLADFGLYLTEDETAYEYRETPLEECPSPEKNHIPSHKNDNPRQRDSAR